MFTYRVGWPGWKTLARHGHPVVLRVYVKYDPEVKSYWTDSPDLPGLTVTGSTLDELRTEVRSAAEGLLDIELNGHAVQAKPELRFEDTALCAA